MKGIISCLIRVLFIGALFLSVAHSSYSQGTQIAKPYLSSAQVYGYLEYLPPDYNLDPTRKFPVIFALHGIGEKGDGSLAQVTKVATHGPPYLIKNNKWPVKSPVTGLFPSSNFIVISPQNANGFFSPDLLRKFIDYVIKTYRADPDRIYLCGLSAGGISVWNYLNKYNDQVAAVISIAGNGNSVTPNACFFKNVPHWAFHGDADTQVNTGGSVNPIKAINACLPPPIPLAKVTIYNGVSHNSWARTYDLTGMSKFDLTYDPFNISIYDWLLSFKRGAVASPLPTANAGPDVTLNLPTNSTTIAGSGTPGTGVISSYAWTKISGPAVTIANETTATLSLSAMVEGVYTFRLTVTNALTETAFDDVKVTVINSNQSPTANAGLDKTITLPTNTLIVNGAGTDSDGSIASYGWTKVSGPTATMGGATTVNLNLSNLLQGTYVFRLTVTDDDGATGTDNVTVTVNAAAVNQPPTVNAGVDKTVNLPTNSSSLTGSASDADGSIATYLWEKLSGPAATLANTNLATVSITNLVAGVYVFRITVTDNLGASASDNAQITVVAANQSPIANAGVDFAITLPTNSTSVPGSGTDPDGTIASYAWTQVSGPNTATLANNTTSSLSASGLIAGSYTFRLTVTDNQASTGFDDIKVTVNAAAVNTIPVANAGPDKTVTLPTNSVILSGSGTDADGSIASYNWSKVSGPTVTLVNNATPNVTANNLVAGTYVFRLTVRDNLNAPGTDLVTVTVQPAVVNQAPVANAGSDISITLPTNSRTLNGTATDADGTVASFAWAKLSGPAATMAGQTTADLQLTALVTGTYVFQLTVTDDKGATGSDNVTLTVNAANVSPIANAGADVTMDLPTNSTTINGSGTDPDGTVSTFSWSQVSGPSTATLANQTTNALGVSNLVAGTYTFRLTVTDNNTASGTDDVKVIVNAANQTPTANAGANKIITLPANTVNFTGNGTDTDGTIASYAWTQLAGAAVTLSNANTKTLTVAVTADGIYTFRLVVTDNNGASDFDDVQLTVNAATVNQAPSANAGANQSITLPSNSLTLSGVGIDPDGTITSYEWSKFSGPSATLTNDNTSTMSLSNLTQGTYIFVLTVTDNGGLTASDDITINVLPSEVNQQPVANAGANQTLTLPTNFIALFGSASDPDGSIATYVWTKESGSTATLANANTPNLTLTDLVQDVYVFRLTVTDDDGATDFDEVTITVNAVAANQNPTANAGTDKTISLPTNSINLSGSASDPDGSIVRYTWVKVSGPPVTLGATNLATVSLASLVEGAYVFRLEVEDNQGGIDTDDVKVTVLPQAVNQPPVVSAGTDKSIFLPENSVILLGTASDGDGNVTTYQWTKVSGGAATLLNATTSILTVNGMVEGVYVFRLTVTDDDTSTSFDEVTVTVNAAGVNQPPVANAGPAKTIKLPTNSVSLTSSSSDIDGTIVTYEWVKLSGPAVTLTNANTATVLLTNMGDGVYVFELTVTDDDGATNTDEVNVSVLPASINSPPVVQASGDFGIQLPENTVILSATAQDDGTITEMLWTKRSGPAATLSGSQTTELTVSSLVAGVYVFRFEVKDDGGLTAFDDVRLTVTAKPVVPPPTVSAGQDLLLELAKNDTTITAVAQSTILIQSFEWAQIAGSPVTISFPDSSILILNGLLPGEYSFRVTVTDDEGQQGTDEVTVVVQEAFVQAFNVFSPNNDGQNDTWIIQNSELLGDCDVSVFNRSGQKVYESAGYNVPWNGTFNGQLLPEGVYFYVIRCLGEDQVDGSLTIIY
jgi:gliding motility-associated-like protein